MVFVTQKKRVLPNDLFAVIGRRLCQLVKNKGMKRDKVLVLTKNKCFLYGIKVLSFVLDILDLD